MDLPEKHPAIFWQVPSRPDENTQLLNSWQKDRNIETYKHIQTPVQKNLQKTKNTDKKHVKTKQEKNEINCK